MFELDERTKTELRDLQDTLLSPLKTSHMYPYLSNDEIRIFRDEVENELAKR